MKEYMKLSRELLDFIEAGPSCYHVIDNIRKELEQNGLTELKETDKWQLTPGAGYFVIRNDSSVVAFRMPVGWSGSEEAVAGKEQQEAVPAKGFHIIASHCDSPTFKVKENPEMVQESQYVKLNTEKYGGMILSSWLDRPLSVAGRIVVEGENGPESRLVNVDKDLLVIPGLAIHMNREVNKGVEYNPQVDMLPLFAGAEGKGLKSRLLSKAAKAAGVKEKEILGQDLFLYVREKGRVIGANGEFLLSPKLDDLQCVFASLKAFTDSYSEHYVNVLAVFDNEEVGSVTRQGAASDLLQTVLKRIVRAQGGTTEEYHRMLAHSFLISADNAHAVHPNHPEKADPTNRPVLNGGPVLKFHGGQKYTTDGKSAALIRQLCKAYEVPCQTYTNRSDIPGGSTLGNIAATHVSVASADVGLPQLAMHSAVETAGSRDLEYGITLFKGFYRL